MAPRNCVKGEKLKLPTIVTFTVQEGDEWIDKDGVTWTVAGVYFNGVALTRIETYTKNISTRTLVKDYQEPKGAGPS